MAGLMLFETVRMPLEPVDGAMAELSCEDAAENKEIEGRVADLVSGLFNFSTSAGNATTPILSTRIYSRYGLSETMDFAAFFHLALFVAYLVFGEGIEVLRNPWVEAKEMKEEPAAQMDLEDEEERETLLSC